MARGKGTGSASTNVGVMPRFVDVRLSVEEKADFMRRQYTDAELTLELQQLCDSGYRIGCAWSSEQSAYTVSLTCRDDKSPNKGLCMTSFAKTLHTAVALAIYKHRFVADEDWLGAAGPGSEDFG